MEGQLEVRGGRGHWFDTQITRLLRAGKTPNEFLVTSGKICCH